MNGYKYKKNNVSVKKCNKNKINNYNVIDRVVLIGDGILNYVIIFICVCICYFQINY